MAVMVVVLHLLTVFMCGTAYHCYGYDFYVDNGEGDGIGKGF